jgi:hypothetical protein
LTPSEESPNPYRNEILEHLKKQFKQFRSTYYSSDGLELFKSQHERAYNGVAKKADAAELYALMLWRFDMLEESIQQFEARDPLTRWEL